MAKRSEASATNLPAVRTRILELGVRGTDGRVGVERVRAVVTELRLLLRSHDEEDGRRMHHFGSRIAWFFGVLADVALDRADFIEFLRLDLGITVETARRAVRVAKYANAEQASWGTTLVLDISSIVDLLARQPALRKAWKVKGVPRTISDLKGVVFTVGDRRPVRFDADRPDPVDVGDLLDALRASAGERTTRLSKADAALDEQLRRACVELPALAGVRAKVKRTPDGPRVVFEIPTKADLSSVAKALVKVLG